MQHLRFFPDYGKADPIWTEDGTGLSLDALPVKEDTRAAVRDWAARWEPVAWQQMDADDFNAGMSDRPAEPPAEATWRSLGDEGRRLCAQVQQELADGWEVIYEGP
jgi:hypothetical protein